MALPVRIDGRGLRLRRDEAAPKVGTPTGLKGGQRLAQAVGAERLDVVAAVEWRDVGYGAAAEATTGLRERRILAILQPVTQVGQYAADLRYWLEKREYTSIAETRGCLSRRSVPDTSPFDRGNYIKTLSSYSLRQTLAAF